MCMNCGCGEPDARHQPTDITREDLQRAADGGGISLEEAASNLRTSGDGRLGVTMSLDSRDAGRCPRLLVSSLGSVGRGHRYTSDLPARATPSIGRGTARRSAHDGRTPSISSISGPMPRDGEVQAMPAKTEKQRKFMGAELQRKREGKKTKTDMSEKELEKFASKDKKD